MSILNILKSYESVPETLQDGLWPGGAWKSLNALNQSNISVPSEMLNKHFPEGGTLIDVAAGACDYIRQIKIESLENGSPTWDLYGVDINASKFNNIEELKLLGINTIDMDFNNLLKCNFTQKVDVQLSNNAVFSDISFTGRSDYNEDFLEKYYKWTIDNFKYLLCGRPNDYWMDKLAHKLYDRSEVVDEKGDRVSHHDFYLYKFV
jgi:hypothetical protein